MSLFALIATGEAITSLLTNTGIVAKVVLAILLLLSLFSWTIIFNKGSAFRLRRRNTRRFLRALYKTGRLSELHAASDSFRPCPAAEVFEAGYDELERQLRPGGGRNLASVERALRAETGDQVGLLETRLSWLATIASASPFIGLFGTVWGIMDAFFDLGNSGSTTLRAVAPGVSEALITTAAGLFAAIPALIAYNQYVHQVRELTTATEECALEFTSRAEEVVSGTAPDRATVATR
ncbi:MAG TPA: MotA/TolQ/ExbB proton channel family protein [Terriglobales bacterium]|nr:MotA/TolQ/ExbB proton channel family protein [Terriglobales bacterium]